MSSSEPVATRDVPVPNREGLHARPVMKFVDLAGRFRSSVSVSNISRSGEVVDGKSAMEMMLLEATQGCVLRIEARGEDAEAAAESLAALIRDSFGMGT